MSPDSSSNAATQHTATIDIDNGYLSLSIQCPFAPTDESRPCWPWDDEADPPEKLPAPQPDCTWDSWCENQSPDENLYGSWRLVGVPIHVDDWDEGPHFILGDVEINPIKTPKADE